MSPHLSGAETTLVLGTFPSQTLDDGIFLTPLPVITIICCVPDFKCQFGVGNGVPGHWSVDFTDTLNKKLL